MSNDKEFVKEITNIEEDIAKWYTDIVKKADLADYTDTKGCMAIKPYGYAIWENIQKYMDNLFKKAGVENVYFPVLIPEGLLQKEKDHVEGFAPEVAWVTEAGEEKLDERLCIRPTSETIISTRRLLSNMEESGDTGFFFIIPSSAFSKDKAKS